MAGIGDSVKSLAASQMIDPMAEELLILAILRPMLHAELWCRIPKPRKPCHRGPEAAPLEPYPRFGVIDNGNSTPLFDNKRSGNCPIDYTARTVLIPREKSAEEPAWAFVEIAEKMPIARIRPKGVCSTGDHVDAFFQWHVTPEHPRHGELRGMLHDPCLDSWML